MPIIENRRSENDVLRASLIPVAQLDTFWPKVERFIGDAAEFAPGRFSAGDLLSELKSGKLSLWLVFADREVIAALTTKVYQVPQARICSIEWVGGERMEEWADSVVELLERYAREAGCSRIEGHGRRGWERLLTRHGWRFLSISFEKPL